MSPKKTSPSIKKDGPVRRIARTIDAAMKDADRARKVALDPAFQKAVQKDRRSALSSFETVRQALADRERIERAKKKKT